MPFTKGMTPINKGKKKDEWKRSKIYTKICPACKKEIKTKRENQIYCNNICYSISEKLHQYSKSSSMIRNNAYKKYHQGHKHSEITKEKIRNNPFRHSFVKGGENPGKNKSPETISKIKEKRLYQKMLKKDTQPEIIIQKLLNALNVKFVKHKPITDIPHKYQCDIFISPNIIIECDGDYYHKYPKGREIDKIRTLELENKKYKVLRLWENEIHNNIESCKNKILGLIK